MIASRIYVARGIVAALAAASLGSCGGGLNTPNGPTVGTPGGPVTPPMQFVKAKLTVTVPAPAHSTLRPHYLSPNTRSVSVTLASVAGNGVSGAGTSVVNTFASAPNCSAQHGGLVCTASIDAAAGDDVFTVTTYQYPNATGPVLSAGTLGAHIGSNGGAVGLSDRLSLSVGGVIAHLSLRLGKSSVPRGKPTDVPVTLRAYDPSGARIVGAADFASPVTLAVQGDAFGAFKLRDGKQAGASLSVPGPSQALWLAYDGNVHAGAITLQASVSQPDTATANQPFAIQGSPPPLPPGTIYVLNAGAHAGAGATVTVYDGQAQGNAAPKRTLALSSSLYARSIALDAAGNLYVGYLDNALGFSTVAGTPDTGNEIAVYPPGASGSTQPSNVIQADSASGSALFPIAIAFDASGNLLTFGAASVSGIAQNVVLTYAPKSSGAVAPSAVWAFASPSIRYAGPTGLTLDGAGNFYLNGQLHTPLGPSSGLFVNAARNADNPSSSPARTVPWDPTTQLQAGEVSDAALDPSGEIFIGNFTVATSGTPTCQAQANVFAAGASGGTTGTPPLRVLRFQGVSTGNSLCYSTTNPLAGFYPFVSVYGGVLFVADGFGNAVDAFAAGASGNVKATRSITGSSTGLNTPIGLVVTAATGATR